MDTVTALERCWFSKPLNRLANLCLRSPKESQAARLDGLRHFVFRRDRWQPRRHRHLRCRGRRTASSWQRRGRRRARFMHAHRDLSAAASGTAAFADSVSTRHGVVVLFAAVALEGANQTTTRPVPRRPRLWWFQASQLAPSPCPPRSPLASSSTCSSVRLEGVPDRRRHDDGS